MKKRTPEGRGYVLRLLAQLRLCRISSETKFFHRCQSVCSLHGADFLQDALLSHRDHDAELSLSVTFRLFGISVLMYPA